MGKYKTGFGLLVLW